MGSPRLRYLMLSAAVIAFDQVVKRLVERSLALHESYPIISGWLNLTHVRNRGAAFGLLSGANLPHQAILFTLLSIAALMAIGYFAYKLPADRKLPQSALALIIGGAIGNLIDRIGHGYVVDFVDAYWRSYHWYAFNVADSAISVGVGLLILDVILDPREKGRQDAGAVATLVRRDD